MANKKKTAALVLTVLAAFVAGGWFFSSLPRWTGGGGEVAALYQEDAAAYGIFDNIPPEDLAAAEAVAAYSLNQDVTLPEDKAAAQTRQDGRALPSQIALAQLSDIEGFAPQEKEPAAAVAPEKEQKPVPLHLSGEEVASVPRRDMAAMDEEESKVTLIAAPVKYFLIKNEAEYKAFKTRARGGYPQADFNKQMIVALESDSNLPDNVFEIDSARTKDGKLVVVYRVNVFDLDKKINTHAVAVVDRTDGEVELKQVL